MTTPDDSLSQRGRALEEAFFRNLDSKLLDEMKQLEATKAAREKLVKQTGLKDEVLVEELIHQGISPEGIVALRLIPLVVVAWADREVTGEERALILEEAAKLGIDPDSVPHRLLEAWLSTPPDSELIDAWQRHTRDVIGTLSDSGRKAFASEMEREMTQVARASGGILGLGSISDAEKRAIEKLKSQLP